MISAARLVARRVAGFVGVVLTSSLVFGALVWWAPGSARGQGQDFFSWMLSFWRGALCLELGASFRGTPIEELVLRGSITSLPVVFGALLLSLLVSLLLAFVLPVRLQSMGRVVRIAVHGASLLPVFLLGYLGLIVFAVPPEGWIPALAAIGILALGDGMLSDTLLQVDAEVESLRERDFVQSAKLRGVPMFRYLLPHLALPLAQTAANKMAFLLGGIVVIEKVLGIQGIGWIGYRAAKEGDFLLLLTITVFITALVALGYLLLDGLRFLVDPRVRRGHSGQVQG